MNYQHENLNIEVINPDLWAVRFSLIPLIPQIKGNLDPTIPADQNPFWVTTSGAMLLNKDHRFYSVIKLVYTKVMKMKFLRLKAELNKISKLKHKSPKQTIYWACLKTEIDRRRFKKELSDT